MKKIIALLICINVLFGFKAVFAEENYDAYYADVLASLNILSDNTAEDELTKGEFCEAVATMMKLNAMESNGEYYFRDVSENNEYYNAITVMAQAGYIKGDENRRFFPDKKITHEFAVTVLIRCLGYESEAEFGGGYTSGYASTAMKLKLSEGITSNGSGNMNAGQLTRMFYNTLMAPVMEYDYNEKTAKSGDLLIYKLYKAFEVNDIVDKNVYTGLEETQGCPEGRVEIGDYEAYTGDTEAEKYLGYSVKALLIENDDEYTVAAITANKKCEDLNITADQISNVRDMFNIEYTSDDGRREKKAVISRNASVIYNYKLLPAYEKNDLNIKTGKITLIDNNGDGKYEVVKVYTYKTYFVSGVNTSSQTIFDKYGYPEIEIGGDDIILNEYGYKIDMSAIGQNSILSVYIPKDYSSGDYRIITVSDGKTVEGKVTGTEQNDGTYVSINSEKYKISERFLEVCKNNQYITQIKVGSEGIFYIDANKEICGFTSKSGVEMYGYLRKLYLSDDEEKTYVEIFTQNGEFITCEVKDRIKINGKSSKKSDLIKNSYLYNGKVIPQLVKYIVNDGNTLISIKYSDKSKVSPFNIDEDQLNFIEDVGYNDGMMRPGGHKYAYKYIYTSDSVIFNVPSSAEQINNNDEYSISNKNFTDGQRLPLSIYDTGYDFVIGAAVNAGSAGENVDYATQQPLTFVESIAEEYSEEKGECVTALHGILNGEKITYTCDQDKTYFDNLKNGDLARIVVNQVTGKVEGVQKIFTFDDAGASAATDPIIYHDQYAVKMPHEKNPVITGNYDYGLSQAYGRCISKSNNTISLNLGNDRIYASEIEKNAPVYMIEKINGKYIMSKTSMDSVIESSSPQDSNGYNIFLNIRNVLTREVFIIMEESEG